MRSGARAPVSARRPPQLTGESSAAQLWLPITVIFVNNAVYGMTGGQMAPTTLMGQRSDDEPRGRDILMGQPMKVAELMAGLDGKICVERVALFDSRQRVKAKKAIKKAVQPQVEEAVG